MTKQTKEQQDVALDPCPFCGGDETSIVENGKMWLGQRYGEPVSVSVRHHCEPTPGQPQRMLERIGKDHESAIAAWNTPTMQAAQVETGVWPERVMQQWDYWRKQIANGDKTSAPRDWFESLAPTTEAQVEPVAWLDSQGFPHHISHFQSLGDMRNGKWKPLYTTPPASSALVGLAEKALATLKTVTTLTSRRYRDQLPKLVKDLTAAIEAEKKGRV
jgi:hypothetical protein